MTSYAFRRGCTDIFLLYPNITDDINEPDIFEINSGFRTDDKITITAMEIPFWTIENLDTMTLEIKLFNTLKTQLDKLKTKSPNR
jgi:5-methylcytosine-specific restriction enzyme subunit McrC